MVRGKTSSGFKYEVNANKIKDVRFIMAKKKMVKTNDGTDLVEMIPMVLGEEQTEALIAHCEKDGISSIDDVSSEFAEIIEALSTGEETKN